MKKNVLVFFTIFVLGTILGTLGTVSFPIRVNITYFWPAAALQTVCGIFFGFWGILGGVTFPIITNAITDGSWAHTIGFIPANIIQCALPRIVMHRFKISLSLMSKRDIVLFVAGCATLPHVLGALTGCTALYMLGNIQSNAEFWQMVFVWVVGNIPCSIVFGFFLVRIFSPILQDSGLFYKGFLNVSVPT